MFDTIGDAEIYYYNSGILNWKWFEGFDEDDLIQYIHEHGNKYVTDGDFDFDQLLRKYLESRGQDQNIVNQQRAI